MHAHRNPAWLLPDRGDNMNLLCIPGKGARNSGALSHDVLGFPLGSSFVNTRRGLRTINVAFELYEDCSEVAGACLNGHHNEHRSPDHMAMPLCSWVQESLFDGVKGQRPPRTPNSRRKRGRAIFRHVHNDYSRFVT